MTIDAAQIELLKALGNGTTGAAMSEGLASLLQGVGGVNGRALSTPLSVASGAVARAGLLDGGLGGVLSSVASGLGGLDGGVLGFSPILEGIRALIEGSSQAALPGLSKYVAPEALSLSLALTDAGQSLGTASYGQTGQPRVAPAITVNVNAIDSKSFSDHSDAIARVVREAMLNSGALTDVMTEL